MQQKVLQTARLDDKITHTDTVSSALGSLTLLPCSSSIKNNERSAPTFKGDFAAPKWESFDSLVWIFEMSSYETHVRFVTANSLQQVNQYLIRINYSVWPSWVNSNWKASRTASRDQYGSVEKLPTVQQSHFSWYSYIQDLGVLRSSFYFKSSHYTFIVTTNRHWLTITKKKWS